MVDYGSRTSHPKVVYLKSPYVYKSGIVGQTSLKKGKTYVLRMKDKRGGLREEREKDGEGGVERRDTPT